MEDFLLENTNIYQFWACILDSHYTLYIVICTCSWYYTECGISAEKRKGIKRDEENRHDKQGLLLLSDEKKLHVTHEKGYVMTLLTSILMFDERITIHCENIQRFPCKFNISEVTWNREYEYTDLFDSKLQLSLLD